MDKRIETLLISAVFEKINKADKFGVEAFKSAMELLMAAPKLFDMVPDEVYISMKEMEETEILAGSFVGLAKDMATNFGENNKDKVNFFEEKGILLYDGIHASAFGRMNFIYSSKGSRIYLFRDCSIKVVTPYATIDHGGFQLKQEIVCDDQIQDLLARSTLNSTFFALHDPNKGKTRILYGIQSSDYSPISKRLLEEVSFWNIC